MGDPSPAPRGVAAAIQVRLQGLARHHRRGLLPPRSSPPPELVPSRRAVDLGERRRWLSRFLDRKELASLAEFTDKVAYISEVCPKPQTFLFSSSSLGLSADDSINLTVQFILLQDGPYPSTD